MPQPPRLHLLPDDPASLPAALAAVWAEGDAAVVAAAVTPGLAPGLAPDPSPAHANLPAPVIAALRGEIELPSGTALVVPTSGSTGRPRAVVLSHAALEASTAASLAALGCRQGERWALALPLRHVAGLQVLARARALGTDPVLVRDPGDPHAIAAASHDAQHVALVPTQLVRCLDAGVDLSAFRSVLVGGGPLAPERAAEARAKGIRLVQSYGMTETCGGCVYDGRPLDGVDVDVADDGCIRLRGPMRATAYLGNVPDDVTEEDAARFTPDGWFVTDDLGQVAPDGTLVVLGRADDVIVTGGVKVVPSAVEALLRELPEIADVVVLGVPDVEWGERVHAIVVPRSDGPPHAPSLASVRAAVTARLGAPHAPRALTFTDRIVCDGLGKITATERTRLASLAAATSDDGRDPVSA